MGVAGPDWHGTVDLRAPAAEAVCALGFLNPGRSRFERPTEIRIGLS